MFMPLLTGCIVPTPFAVRSGRPRAELPGDVPAQLLGVVAHAVDQVRVAPAQVLQPEDVQTGSRRDAAAVKQLAVVADDGHREPRIAAPVTGGPDHRVDPLGAQVDRRRGPAWPDG